MDLNAGDVIVNLKSGKEYAVFEVRMVGGLGPEYVVSYVGIRNGKNYGPIRASRFTNVAATFGKTAKTATFANGWQIDSVSTPNHQEG